MVDSHHRLTHKGAWHLLSTRGAHDLARHKYLDHGPYIDTDIDTESLIHFDLQWTTLAATRTLSYI